MGVISLKSSAWGQQLEKCASGAISLKISQARYPIFSFELGAPESRQAHPGPL